MATKQKLIGSFGSLSDSLAFRFNPASPPDVSSRWLGAMARTAAIAHRSADWTALPNESSDYDGIIAQLDDATHAIVSASTDAERLDALEQANEALGDLSTILA